MASIIGELIPLAFGIAISPVPIVVGILVLLSPRARSSGVGFLLGWIAGIVGVVLLAMFAFAGVPSDNDPRPAAGVITIILGTLLVVLAVRAWRRRPRPGEPPRRAPKWMAMISRITFLRALLLGFVLSAFNPVNLLVSIGAGVAIGSQPDTVGDIAIEITVFTAIGASTVALPVFALLIAGPSRIRAPLDAMRQWLQRYTTAMTCVVLLVVGVALIGKGIGNF
jgi:hypothetical protein